MTDSLVAEKPLSLVTGEIKRPKTVCFVCTGNTCRSPMAEAMLNHLAAKKNVPIRAFSAGISAVNGDPISSGAVRALKKAGVLNTPENDYESHTAKMISEDALKAADEVVAISESHMMALIYTYPQYADKITVMPVNIPDPFMYGDAVYEKCLATVTECIERMYLL
jgi:protein-tyrosine phosphatase